MTVLLFFLDHFAELSLPNYEHGIFHSLTLLNLGPQLRSLVRVGFRLLLITSILWSLETIAVTIALD